MRMDRLDRSQLMAVFHESFADYAIDMSAVTAEMKHVRSVKNAVDWDVSVGVFDGEQMVAFTMIAIDSFLGQRTAFDACTGVIPSARRQGLAGRMLEHAVPELRARKVTQFALEVLESNTPAIRAYQRAGFVVARSLRCYTLHLDRLARGSGYRISPISREQAVALDDEIACEPSYEHRTAAIARIPGELVLRGAFDGNECVGSLVYAPLLNWIMRLVVKRTHRRRGVARSLLASLGDASTSRSVRVLNVDAKNQPFCGLMRAVGAEHIGDQFEMRRAI